MVLVNLNMIKIYYKNLKKYLIVFMVFKITLCLKYIKDNFAIINYGISKCININAFI